MTTNSRESDLERRPCLFSSGEFRSGLYILVLVALLNTLRVTYNMGYSAGWDDGAYAASQAFLSGHNPIELRQLRIALTLVVMALGFWSRRVAGIYVAMVSIMWIGWEYLDWWQFSLNWLQQAEVISFSEVHNPDLKYVGQLFGASWWDIGVLLITAMMLAWLLRFSTPYLARLLRTKGWS